MLHRFFCQFQAALVCVLLCHSLGDDEQVALKQGQQHTHRVQYQGGKQPRATIKEPAGQPATNQKGIRIVYAESPEGATARIQQRSQQSIKIPRAARAKWVTRKDQEGRGRSSSFSKTSFRLAEDRQDRSRSQSRNRSRSKSRDKSGPSDVASASESLVSSPPRAPLKRSADYLTHNFIGHELENEANDAGDDYDENLASSLGALATAHAPILRAELVSQARNLSLLAQDFAAANATRAELFSALRHAWGEATQVEAATSDHHKVARAQTAEDRTSLVKAYFEKRFECSPFALDPFASARFCRAQCEAVQDSENQGILRSWEPRTAVCLVGMARTMARPDVRDGLRFNLLAGWGDRHRGLFAVIARNTTDEAEPDHESVEGVLATLR